MTVNVKSTFKGVIMKKIVVFAPLGLMVLLPFLIFARTITVVVASKSSGKAAATLAAFKEKFVDDAIEIIPYQSASLVPDQPIGYTVALKGARNRLQGLPEHLIATADYLVAIENYIEQSSLSHNWYDVGLVLCKQVSPASEQIVLTQLTPIPDHFVQLAQSMSPAGTISDEGYPVTIGQTIQWTFISCDREVDPADWHKEPEFGGVSRQKLLQDAFFKALHAKEIDFLKSLLVLYPDFPKPGILFVDFFPLLKDSVGFQSIIDLLYERYKGKDIGAVVGLESRGFILGAALAYQLGVGFVPVRKPGKLPGAVYSVEYKKEYGTDTLVIAKNALKPGQRVLVIDDLIATGGSARAALELVTLAGGTTVEFISLLQVKELAEKARLGVPSFNVID